MNNIKLEKISNNIRKNIIEMIFNAQSGHPGGALGLADLFTYLYFEKVDSSLIRKSSKDRDFIFLSNGHTCPVLYSTFFELGFFDKKTLLSYRKLGGLLQGHPHYGTLNGIENSGGPLGQGISQAVGLAHSFKRDGKKNKVYCFIGDGELGEGQCWEALLYAGSNNLDNLIIILDRNHMQIDGDTKDVLKLEPLNKKISSFNLATIEFNGNNFNQIRAAFLHAQKIKNKTVFLIANTIPGKGVSFMENDFHWHGKAPSKDEYEKAMEELK